MNFEYFLSSLNNEQLTALFNELKAIMEETNYISSEKLVDAFENAELLMEHRGLLEE